MEWMIVVRYVEEARSLEAKRRLGSGGWGTLEVCDGLGGDRGVWGLGFGVWGYFLVVLEWSES